MKKLILAFFLLILSFAFLILPAISEAQGRPGGGGGYLGGVVGRGGSPGGPGGGGGYLGPHGGGGGYLGGVVGRGVPPGGTYGGPYRGYYGWDHHGHYRGYYPYWGYYPFFWGAAIVGWPYAYYSGWPYLGWPYYPPEVTEAPPAHSEPSQQQSYYWYYCQDPEGYYPYVKSCPGGWIEVEPKVAPPKQ